MGRRHRSAACAALAALVVAAGTAFGGGGDGADPAGWPRVAVLYTWQDEQGAVHVTDVPPAEKPAVAGQPGKSGKAGAPAAPVTRIEDARPASAPAGPHRSPRERAILAMLDKARVLPGYAEVQRIAAEYHQSHTYLNSATDYFVCLDMALEMANILKTSGFSPKVVAGSSSSDTGLMDYGAIRQALNHAWVAVELQRGVQVAVEATGGYVADGDVPRFEYYYQGLVFDSPREARDASDLMVATGRECREAEALVKEWNATYQGRQATPKASEAKGRTEAKIAECRKRHLALEELIKRRYRALY